MWLSGHLWFPPDKADTFQIGRDARTGQYIPVIVKLIEDAEAAQLRYQSPKQFRPDRNEQPYHKPDYQSHDCAGSYSARKHLLFAGRHFNLPKAWETLPHSQVNCNSTGGAGG
jgi:hypothetical protein